MFASGTISTGQIKYIKIELGTQNSLVKDSVAYPLTLPADLNAVVLLKLRGNEWEQWAPGRRRLWLDFDIARSIIRVRDGRFVLRPILRWFIVNATGSLQGKVKPMDAFPVISVYKGSDTADALPGIGGDFAVRGLPDGTYNVFINASNGYQDTTITNIPVAAGKQTKLGNITLHK